MAVKLYSSKYLDIYSAMTDSELKLPLINGGINAGFPSPALDFEDIKIDLNKYLTKHPTATFYARVKGESMKDAGINHGDLVVIDRSIDPSNNKIAVCFIDGEFTLKQINIEKKVVWLMPANEDFKPIKVTAENDFLIWGVVTHIIKSV